MVRKEEEGDRVAVGIAARWTAGRGYEESAAFRVCAAGSKTTAGTVAGPSLAVLMRRPRLLDRRSGTRPPDIVGCAVPGGQLLPRCGRVEPVL